MKNETTGDRAGFSCRRADDCWYPQCSCPLKPVTDKPARPQTTLTCEHCAIWGFPNVTEGVQWESSRTAYHFEGLIGSPDDPNRPVALCRACAKDHHQHWDDMWADAPNASNAL